MSTTATIIFWAVIAIIILETIWDAVLDHLNVKASKLPIPDLLKGIYDEATYRRQQEYFAANTRFGRISSGFDTALSLVLFASGIFGWLSAVLGGWTGSVVLQTFLFMCITSAVSEIFGIPFSYYRTFVIEERFGFNKTTRKTFAGDAVKGFLIDIVISGGLMAALCAIYSWIPDIFWIVGFAALALFNVVLSYFYSEIIVPLFNKQTPLEEGELRSAITSFADKAGFRLKDIYVIDGSKRSTKANAYFTGFGKKKRIVLYDTLIDKMTTEETVAVLAHEIGHYKRGHVWKGVFISLLQSLAMMYVLGLVLSSDDIAQAAGADKASFYINMFVFTMLWTPVSFVLDIVENVLSRRNERQADAFACSHGLGVALASALKKLSADSLSNLTPHPAVVYTSYSHPTLLQRVQACIKDNG